MMIKTLTIIIAQIVYSGTQFKRLSSNLTVFVTSCLVKCIHAKSASTCTAKFNTQASHFSFPFLWNWGFSPSVQIECEWMKEGKSVTTKPQRTEIVPHFISCDLKRWPSNKASSLITFALIRGILKATANSSSETMIHQTAFHAYSDIIDIKVKYYIFGVVIWLWGTGWGTNGSIKLQFLNNSKMIIWFSQIRMCETCSIWLVVHCRIVGRYGLCHRSRFSFLQSTSSSHIKHRQYSCYQCLLLPILLLALPPLPLMLLLLL